MSVKKKNSRTIDLIVIIGICILAMNKNSNDEVDKLYQSVICGVKILIYPKIKIIRKLSQIMSTNDSVHILDLSCALK